MKAYTDKGQSQKLAEILPLESADMRFAPFGDTHPWFRDCDIIEIGAEPCWSLSALLSVFPITVGRDMGMFCCWQNDHNLYSRHYNNPVDACFELLIKLHELNLLKPSTDYEKRNHQRKASAPEDQQDHGSISASK